jgi:hypothetical protein
MAIEYVMEQPIDAVDAEQANTPSFHVYGIGSIAEFRFPAGQLV